MPPARAMRGVCAWARSCVVASLLQKTVPGHIRGWGNRFTLPLPLYALGLYRGWRATFTDVTLLIFSLLPLPGEKLVEVLPRGPCSSHYTGDISCSTLGVMTATGRWRSPVWFFWQSIMEIDIHSGPTICQRGQPIPRSHTALDDPGVCNGITHLTYLLQPQFIHCNQGMPGTCT